MEVALSVTYEFAVSLEIALLLLALDLLRLLFA